MGKEKILDQHMLAICEEINVAVEEHPIDVKKVNELVRQLPGRHVDEEKIRIIIEDVVKRLNTTIINLLRDELDLDRDQKQAGMLIDRMNTAVKTDPELGAMRLRVITNDNNELMKLLRKDIRFAAAHKAVEDEIRRLVRQIRRQE